jgi:hypothetical protein
MKRILSTILVLILAALACNLPPNSAPGATSSPTAIPATSTSIATATATPKPIDITHHPLYWFAPLPPQPGGPYDGSDDFMDLFTPHSEWTQAAAYIQVFKLYGGWAARDSTDAQLRQAIAEIRQRGFALGVELGPLNPTDQCGIYIEGFAGEEGVRTVKRIKALGGELNFIAFDEPYYYGHFYDGEQACNWPAEKIARDIDAFIRLVRAEFPDVIIGDIEPLTGAAGAKAYNDWLDTFHAVNGYDLAFLHLDIDWSNTGWPEMAKAVQDHGQRIGIPIGIIYTGNFQDETDEAWLSIAGERVKRYESVSGVEPDHVIFQSWNDKPDRVLPDSEPFTFTGFIRTYFEDKSALGFQTQNIENVALKKNVRVSRLVDGYGGESAVDGDPGTSWSSGEHALQWIEIDLGAAYDIREIRLLPSQYPAGATRHRIRGKGPDTGGSFIDLHIFAGPSEDSKWLVVSPPEPWPAIQIIRIETTASPSWVAWREIEILR